MSNTAIYKLLDLPDFLKSHFIYHREGLQLGIRWADRLIRYFSSEVSVQSVTYPVNVYIESIKYPGFLEVRRDGSHAIRLEH